MADGWAMRRWSLLLLALPCFMLSQADAAVDPEVLTPVPIVQDGRLDVKTDHGEGLLPIHVSRDWSRPQPEVKRAVIIVHGWPRRDLRSGEAAAARAGAAAQDAILITPQFLTQTDIDAHHLPGAVLRWGINGWASGRDAEGAAGISSFEAMDAILARLADRQLFPHLSIVVIAGHSAGGRFVQHYAAVTKGERPLLAAGVHLRYVVANPSAYLYFTEARPLPPAAACPGLDRWEYGFGGGLPRYVAEPVDPSALRRAYLARDIVYLLGTADNDPNHYQLDRSCAAEAQGPTRLERGRAYVEAMGQERRLLEVPGIGHHSSQIFASGCGRLALFDQGQCP